MNAAIRFDAGTRQDEYPLRASVEPGAAHSLAMRGSDFRILDKRFRKFQRIMSALAADPGSDNASMVSGDTRQLDTNRIAHAFARFAVELATVHGLDVSRSHLVSAFSMLHRRAEGVSSRIDRVIVVGLVTAALADVGMRVHVVVDGQWAIPYTRRWLIPVLERLGIKVGVVQTGDDEATRRAAYTELVTLVSVRECAMDFLRDAHNWPQRGDDSVRVIDRLLGARSRRKAALLRGLPCAVLVDIDSALIDNARTPIVLTRDAHPMHELEELSRALQMVEYFQSPAHFVFVDSDAEVALTPAGKQQLHAYAEQLGGIWSVPHVAELILSAAVVVVHLIKPGIHYRIESHTVEWLVDDLLVPGMAFYTRAFISRIVEVREQCSAGGPREVIGRASYQQVFNRYVHLCGAGHMLEPIRHELRTVYGLESMQREGRRDGISFNRSLLLSSSDEKMQWLSQWLTERESGHCLVVTANSIQSVEQIHALLIATVPNAVMVTEAEGKDLSQLLVADNVVVALAQVMDYLVGAQGEVIRCPVRAVIAQRSMRICEDRRNLFWMRGQRYTDFRSTLLLAADDDLFEEIPIHGLLRGLRRVGIQSTGFLLERLIRRIQSEKGRALYRVRRDLLSHDASMQGLLSFSGRGIYE
jgi:preprotein translocase subunit SecA